MIIEVRILSRGGQGGVTGAKLLAQTGHLGNKFVQAIPKYGAERKGAPIFADIRIADEEIKTHAPVIAGNTHSFIILENSDEIVCQIPFEEINKDTIIVVNSPDIPPSLRGMKFKIGIVDAISISQECGLIKSGTALVSTIMLGAWIKATSLLKLETLEKAITLKFGSTDIAKRNIKAIKMAYDQFKFVN